MSDPTDAPLMSSMLESAAQEEVFVPMTRREMFFVLDCVRKDGQSKEWTQRHEEFTLTILNAMRELQDQ